MRNANNARPARFKHSGTSGIEEPVYTFDREQQHRFFTFLLSVFLIAEVILLAIDVIDGRLDLIPVLVLPFILPTAAALWAARKWGTERVATIFIFYIFTAEGVGRLFFEPDYAQSFILLPALVVITHYLLGRRLALIACSYMFVLIVLFSAVVHFFRPFETVYGNNELGASLWIVAVAAATATVWGHVNYLRRINALLGEMRLQMRELEGMREDYRNLLSVLIHDLSNGLMVVRGAFDRISDAGAGAAKRERYLEYAGKGATLMSDMVSNMRQLQASVGREATTLAKRVPIANVNSGILLFFKQGLRLKNLKLEFINNTPPEAAIEVMPLAFTFDIVNNILSNALKFAIPGSKLTVEWQDHGEFINMRVTNHAPKYPDNLLRAMDGDYSSESEPGTASERGQGLGLRIVNRLAGKMNVRTGAEALPAPDGNVFLVTVTLQIPNANRGGPT